MLFLLIFADINLPLTIPNDSFTSHSSWIARIVYWGGSHSPPKQVDRMATVKLCLDLKILYVNTKCPITNQFNPFDYLLCLFNTYNAIHSVLPRLLAQNLPGYLNYNLSFLICIQNFLFSFRLGRFFNPCPIFLTAAKGWPFIKDHCGNC